MGFFWIAKMLIMSLRAEIELSVDAACYRALEASDFHGALRRLDVDVQDTPSVNDFVVVQ
jgi:hypothetical protein